METNDIEAVIFDSSGLISILHEDDSLHERAVAILGPLEDQRIDLIIPSEVFAETINAIGKRFGNPFAITAGNALLERRFYIAQSDDALLKATLDRLTRQKNSVSFIDCLVMAWADHYGTKTIFGFDGAFAANGYSLPGRPASSDAT